MAEIYDEKKRHGSNSGLVKVGVSSAFFSILYAAESNGMIVVGEGGFRY